VQLPAAVGSAHALIDAVLPTPDRLTLLAVVLSDLAICCGETDSAALSGLDINLRVTLQVASTHNS
jgi:hypothetical protein